MRTLTINGNTNWLEAAAIIGAIHWVANKPNIPDPKTYTQWVNLAKNYMVLAIKEN